MISFQKIESLEQIVPPEGELYLAIGIFDGLHKGHQSLLKMALEDAKKHGGKLGILTFYPHPTRLFSKENYQELILPLDDKLLIAECLGVEFLIEQNFSLEFAKIKAEDFLLLLKRYLPGLKGIFVGENFRFGHGQIGTIETLKGLGKTLDIKVNSITPLKNDKDKDELKISSSTIRDHLKDGEVSLANQLLGYRYFVREELIKGRAQGRLLGFPTLNFRWRNELKICKGVYAVRLTDKVNATPFKFGQYTYGIANFGIRPTFDHTTEPVLEVHLFETPDYSEGQLLRIEFWEFIRPEMKFDSVEQLKSQIAQDVLFVKKMFGLIC